MKLWHVLVVFAALQVASLVAWRYGLVHWTWCGWRLGA